MTKVKKMPNSFKWLSEGLQEAALQSVRGDVGIVAKAVSKTEQAIRPYFKGEIADIDTGKAVLIELRKIILDREKEIKKLVA